MSAAAQDLNRWIPRLIRAWRSHRKLRGGGPENALTAQELREVGAGVRQLSHGLTRDRALAGARYMDDPKLLGAYLLFYWPVSYAQAREALGELSGRHRVALDLGSGPGPVAFAAQDAGASDLTLADRSESALALARALALEADEAVKTRPWDPNKQNSLPEPGPFDLITIGHLLNELFGKLPAALGRRVALLETALGRLKPGGTLLILEPALRETSRGLLQLRDALVSKGYVVRAPCMYRGACPALVKDTDWCHAERAWAMPKLVEDLARSAGLHKEALKMSYLALAPKGEDWRALPEGRLFRIVSEPLQGKGRHRYIGCGPEGRIGLALQDKHRTEANAPFFELKRGDVVRVSETEARGDGLSLTERSEATVVAPAGWSLPDHQSE